MLQKMLQDTVDMWEKLGHPALLERFVLRNGKPYQPRKRIGRKRPDKACFSNATEFVFDGDIFEGDKGKYVEGFAYRPGLFPVHHAWVDIDGKAMDPTWKDSDECEYFGVPFEKNVVRDELLKNKVYGLLDTGMINIELLFRLDPELKNIWDKIRLEPNLNKTGELSK